MLQGKRKVAMQYSPQNMVPYVGLVDAGTVELVRSLGVEVVTSGDLVAQFEAPWTAEQIASHFDAGRAIDAVTQEAFREIGRRVRHGSTHEFEMQQWIDEAMAREGLTNENDPPIVAVNAHSGNPHYGPTAEHSSPIRQGDLVLLDIWAKKRQPGSVYYDITWTGCVGQAPSRRQQEIFEVVRGARDTGVQWVLEAVAAGRRLCGWEVDRAVRDYVDRAGYADCFVHRTGHSIGEAVHGNGANLDDLETRDEREIVPNSCFSVEPGIYLPEFGVRSEVDVLVRQRSAEVTGKIQREIVIA
jgi:Xaa-Pro aminopeptidase